MIKTVFVFLITGICILAMLSPVFSQLEESVNVGLIEVWVKVTDKHDQPVSDLSPNDFQVLIDGKKMDIRCFDNVFRGPSKTDELTADPSLPSRQKRQFIFFFDMLNTKPGDMNFLKSQMVDFLKKSFTPNDEGMIFVLLPTFRLGVVQKMTSNQEILMDVIQKIRGNESLEARLRSNERLLLDVLYPGGTGGDVTQVDTSSPRAGRSAEFGRQARQMAGTLAAQDLNQNRLTLKSFLEIANYLSGNRFDGRLVMIYVSGGFPLIPGSNYFEIVSKALEYEEARGSDQSFREHADYDFQKELRNTIATLNRLNVTIYSIDAGGLIENNRGAERSSVQLQLGYDNVSYERELQDSLEMIANETGGFAFLNSQNFEKGLSDIATDMSQQYWLCTNIPRAEKSGKYHKIEVKVARADLNVRARKGYID